MSVTGGEPLLWPAFLLALRAMVGPRRLHLETGGGHPRTLAAVIEAFDHVSLDLKLPADLAPPEELAATGAPDPNAARVTEERAPRDEREWSTARRAALELLAGRDAALKLVVAGGRAARDYQPLLEDVAARAPDVPLFVQPVTPMGGVAAASLALLNEIAEDARELELAVRVVPQVHRLLGVP